MRKLLLILLLIVLIIIVVPLIVALFLNKSYEVSRTIEISRPYDAVWNYVIYLKNQNEYSVWSKMDPHMKTEYRGEDGKVGFVSAWESENPDVGKGEQEIVAITDGRIEYEIRFLEPFRRTSKSFLEVTALNQTTTRVNWGISGKIGYPLNLLLLVMNFEKMIGKDLEQGLLNLKQILEHSAPLEPSNE